MTIVTIGSDRVFEQITKQLNKLVDVVKLMVLTEGSHVERELMLVKVKAVNELRDEVKRLSEIFRGRIVDVTDSVYTIELTGTSEKLDAFVETLSLTEILEVVRSGVTGISRGDSALAISKIQPKKSST